MKGPLVINYTELDFPRDGIKYNEGHVIAESLRRSMLDQIVISTGFKYNSHSIDPLRAKRKWIPQGTIANEHLHAEVIHPGNDRVRVFDFDTHWFTPGYLEEKLESHQRIVLNFHSLDPRHIGITEKLDQLPRDRINCIFSVHNPRLYDDLVHNDVDFAGFFDQMDGFIAFSKAVVKELDIPNKKVRYVQLGVDEEGYSLGSIDKAKNIVATHMLHSYQRFYPFNLNIARGLLGMNDEVVVKLDVSQQNKAYAPPISEMIPYIQEGRFSKGNFLYDIGSPGKENLFENCNVFLSPYKTMECSVSILKALMSGVPVVAPKNKYYADILDESNSIALPSDGIGFNSCGLTSDYMPAVNAALQQLGSFSSGRYNPSAIRRSLIEKGYTAKKMVKQLDEALVSGSN